MNAPRDAMLKWAGVYAGACALGVPAWWLALHYSPMARELFVPAASWRGFQPLILPDMLLALLCAMLAGQLLRRRFPPGLVGATCGGWAYATAYSISWTLAVGASLLGAALMAATLGGFVAFWYALVSTRQAGPA